MIYFIAPFLGWLISGSLKFFINYIRFGKGAFGKIGNGGFPSTHTTIIVTSVTLVGLKEGLNTPIFGLGLAIALIVIIDAIGLRRNVGKHAKIINKMIIINKLGESGLRESMGHKKHEVIGGIILGILIGSFLYLLNNLI
ncbi:divergent PAP2 family protein [Paenibacillus doosanensis]|uniref:divergent PAP2 family protein n=1 Tax=Paenibacillus doosanensis TaxID=1229154 RepID=UPI00217F2E5C|nr:divergent PAP2 family protein [Paenibacillus doosanensis]MCS7464245.1 divergent PAP2 family protein [Paenibacillus doosanensis]